MINRTSTSNISTSCSECRNCTTTCSIYVHYTTFIEIDNCCASEQQYTENIYHITVPEKKFFVRRVDIKDFNFQIRLEKQKLKQQYSFFYKPVIKRRLLISKSGWLPKDVRNRKKGH